MTPGATRAWYLVHKWTSIACTAFLLLLCLTGLPLIFHHEIDEVTRAPTIVAKPDGQANLDRVLADAAARHPGTTPLFLSWDTDKPLMFVTVAPTPTADESQMKFMLYDARDGARVEAPPLESGVMNFLFELHANLLLGLPGEFFVGFVGVVFLVAVVSGVVVYAPFMRRLAFGTVRKGRSTRLKWLDLHNMTGIVTVAWVGVVALTGFIITMSLPLTAIWQASELAEVSAPYAGSPVPARRASIDAAVRTVRQALPGERISFIAFPGTDYSTRHHYMMAMAGDTPLTERLVHPAFVDVADGRLTDVRALPWYMQALFLSVPLHFGDYGGLPLKIVWALLDVVAIIVLGSGLYLWLGRRRTSLDRRIGELTSGGEREATA